MIKTNRNSFMNKLRKAFAGVLAAAMMCALCSCGADKTNTDNNNGNISTESTDTGNADTGNTDNGNADNGNADNGNTESGNNDTSSQPGEGSETLGNQLANMFLTEIKESSDIEAIANDLANAADMNCVVIPAAEGYLNGFSEEIKGFSKGFQFSPMIGSIAFVGYIFETDDAEAMKSKLTSVADPRWNICTEAAETVCVTYENYVFFTMCPGADY